MSLLSLALLARYKDFCFWDFNITRCDTEVTANRPELVKKLTLKGNAGPFQDYNHNIRHPEVDKRGGSLELSWPLLNLFAPA